jgi:SulP family sulfate permease
MAFKGYLKSITQNPKNDILSGLTVALALVPEAVAFAFVAGIDPLVGLYGAFIMGIITAIFGGRPGMVSGATGALAVVMVDLVKEGNAMDGNGLIYLFITLLLVGIIQMSAGFLKLGKFVRLIPHPVMMGFVNGLAIVIFLAQIGMFKDFVTSRFDKPKAVTESIAKTHEIKDGEIFLVNAENPSFTIEKDSIRNISTSQVEFIIDGNQVYDLSTEKEAFNLELTDPSSNDYIEGSLHSIKTDGVQKEWMSNKNLMIMIALVLLTMAIMYFLPKLTKKIPSALVAIVVVSAIAIGFNLDVSSVGSFIKDGGGDGLKGGLPVFQSNIFTDVPWNWDMIKFIAPYAFILAAIGLIESLMTLGLVDEMTNTKGNGNRECVAQGGANLLNGLFGGMGGCAMIGQSIINVNSGGRGRLSAIFASVTLLCFILFASPVIEKIPIAALVGVMFMVVIGTFAWSSFRILHKIPLGDAIVLISVSLITVFADLAVAVIIGVIMSALIFAWQNAIRIRARKRVKDDGTKVYTIWGPLFFGSITAFNQKFDIVGDPEKIEIDFIESKVQDHSGIEAIENIVKKYKEAGKSVQLTHLSEDCKLLLLKANEEFEEIIKTDIDDPRYYVLGEKGFE